MAKQDISSHFYGGKLVCLWFGAESLLCILSAPCVSSQRDRRVTWTKIGNIFEQQLILSFLSLFAHAMAHTRVRSHIYTLQCACVHMGMLQQFLHLSGFSCFTVDKQRVFLLLAGTRRIALTFVNAENTTFFLLFRFKLIFFFFCGGNIFCRFYSCILFIYLFISIIFLLFLPSLVWVGGGFAIDISPLFLVL